LYIGDANRSFYNGDRIYPLLDLRRKKLVEAKLAGEMKASGGMGFSTSLSKPFWDNCLEARKMKRARGKVKVAKHLFKRRRYGQETFAIKRVRSL